MTSVTLFSLGCMAGLAAAMLGLAIGRLRQARQSKTATAPDTSPGQPAAIIDAVQRLPAGLALFDGDGRLVMCNEAYRQAYPLTADLLVPGTPFADILRAATARGDFLAPGEDTDDWIEARLRRQLASHEPLCTQLGNGRWYRIEERPTGDGGVVKLLIDITEAKASETQLLVARRAERIGRLAIGLVHAFNNGLTAIGGNAELARVNINNRRLTETALGEIQAMTDRVGALARRLGALADDRNVVGGRARPAEILTELQGVAAAMLDGPDSLVMKLQDGNAQVSAPVALVEQAALALILIAQKYREHGEHLTLATELTELDEGFVQAFGGQRIGRHLALKAAWTGDAARPPVEDVDAAALAALTRAAGGFMHCEAGRHDAAITLYLPLITAPTAMAKSATAIAKVSSVRPNSRILVVDDEASVCDYVSLALTDLGYQVLRADDGPSALATLQQQQPIDLVLTDVMMPGMTGPELAQRIDTICPHTRVIFMSGYENRRPANSRLVGGGDVCLFKPFNMDTLAQAVRQAIPQSDDGQQNRGVA